MDIKKKLFLANSPPLTSQIFCLLHKIILEDLCISMLIHEIHVLELQIEVNVYDPRSF